MNLQELPSPPAANDEVRVNENFEALDFLSIFAKDPETTASLTWGYIGGRYDASTTVSAGTVTLTDDTTNYVVFHRTTAAVSVSTATTNWDDTTTYGKLYKVVTADGVVSGTPEDHRLAGLIGSAGASGTVTSVAASVPSFLSISGSPITTSGTLAITYSGTALPVANGGTGATTLTANNVVLGNGTSAVQFVAPGSSGNVLTSNGTTWTSAAPGAGSGDVVGPASSVDAEIALFDSTTGKLLKRATGTGYAKVTSGVLSADSASTVTADLQGTGLDVDAAGFRGIPQNAQTGNYTLVAADAGKHIYHASGAGAGDTYTIPANGSVAYEIGTSITFVNLDSNAVSIAITTDTMNLAGTGTTGTRTLAQYGVATALKLTSTTWIISGTGLT
jgi:hypothetical protein